MYRRMVITFLLLMVTQPAWAADPLLTILESTPRQSVPQQDRLYGEITPEEPTFRTTYDLLTGRSYQIQVVALTPQLDITLRIYQETGAITYFATNPAHQPILTRIYSPISDGTYTVEVSSENSEGEFVLFVTELDLPRPRILEEGVSQTQTLAPEEIHRYEITAHPNNNLALELSGIVENSQLNLLLQDDSAQPIVSATSGILGHVVVLPTLSGSYILQIINYADTPTDYTISLQVIIPSEEAASTVGASLPPLPINGTCVLATIRNNRLNVRNGDSSDYRILTSLSPFVIYDVTGQNAVASWYQIDFGDGIGWVSSLTTRLGGNCQNIPTVEPPPLTSRPSNDDEEVDIDSTEDTDLELDDPTSTETPTTDEERDTNIDTPTEPTMPDTEPETTPEPATEGDSGS